MAGVNKVILVGNLGQDPQISYTKDSKAIATISIATSQSWTDKNSGEKKEKTEWHRVVVFGKLADIAKQYLKKGLKVYVEGSLQTRKWQDKDGQDRYTTEVVLQGFGSTLQMLDGRSDSNSTNNNQSQNPNQSNKATGGDFDDDIPF